MWHKSCEAQAVDALKEADVAIWCAEAGVSPDRFVWARDAKA